MNKIAVFFATGYEEIEALTVVDLCRRAGIVVDMVSVTGKETVTGSHKISVAMDKMIADVDFAEYDMLILPGGMPGTLNLDASPIVHKALDSAVSADSYIAAICAAPSILGARKLLVGKEAICYPGFEDKLEGATISDKKVVVDGKIITAAGMGVALEFGLVLVSLLCGKEKSDTLRKSVIAD